MYHVPNRGNGRMRLFPKAEDFEAFERVLAEGHFRAQEFLWHVDVSDWP